MRKHTKVLVWIVYCVIQFGICQSSPVEGFELDVGFENFVYLDDGTDFTVNYVYTSGTSPAIDASIDTGTALEATVTHGTTSGTVVVRSSTLSGASTDFGTYLLTLVLSNSENNQTKEMVVFYEEQIEGFQVTLDNVYIPVNEEVQFDVVLTKGSNVELEWFLDGNDTCLIEYFGTLRTATKNHTFTTEGEYNVTIIAANTISRTMTSLLVTVQNRVNGFTVTNDEGPIDTNTNVGFTVKLNSSAILPMGGIFMNLSYGDGQVDSVDLQSLISTMQSAGGHTVNHQYTIQGNYSVDVVVYNEIDSMSFPLNVYIWDDLSVYLSADIVSAKVAEVVTFQFSSTPSSGFQYYIEYGDGNITENISSEILYSTFNVPSWTYSFLSPNQYSVKMSAWNQFYVSNYVLTILVQNEIPTSDISISPTIDEIPLPDGIMTFTFQMTANNPSPSNVTCNFDYGDYLEANVSTDIIYGSPITKTYTYTSGGSKSISFTCSNAVSTVTKTSTVTVRAFTLNDFSITYDLLIGMNMTDANEDQNKFPDPVNIPVSVPFQISLFSVSRLPPDITFSWDFGDGTTVESGIISDFYKNHTFTNRGSFTIQLEMSSVNDSRSVSLPIQLGAITFTSDITKGEIGIATFTFTASGLVGGSYTFSLYPGHSAVVSTEPATTSTKYNNWGKYFPYVTGINATFLETVYSEPVAADYFIAGMYSFTNESVNLPPGNTQVVIGLPTNAQPLPNVTCYFDMNDFVDPKVEIASQNISDSNPLIFNYIYKALGEHKATFNCSNPLSEFYNETTIMAINECFKITGIFDRQYSSQTTPMKASTSANVDLKNRMPVKCPQDNPRFEWEFFNIEGGNETVFQKDLPDPVLGTVRFARGETPEGLYKVSLNISLWGDDPTWIHEFTYLLFEKQPPYVFIVGGNQKTSKIAMVDINALDESYDTEKGHGYQASLNFTWYCHRFNTSDLTELDTLYNDEIKSQNSGDSISYLKAAVNDTSYCGQLLTETTKGKATLNATEPDYKGYIIIVEACVPSINGPQCSSFMQMIQALEGEPPDTKIECQINCKEKYAITTKMNVRAICNDCNEEENTRLQYLWELNEYRENDGTSIPFLNFTDMTDTGITTSSLVLKPNTLIAGKTYVLSVTMSLYTRKADGKASTTLIANYPPYGGSCYAEPTTGNATTTPFSFLCSDWLDEGTNDVQNITVDTAAKEPLTYEYISYTKKYVSGVFEETEVPLFKGSESTATEILMSVGDEQFDYNVTICIKIIDYFGDSTYFNLTITVMPDMSMIPTGPDDTAALDIMMQSFDGTFAEVDAGGNIMAAVQVIGTTASLFSSSLIPQDNNSVSTSDDVLSQALSGGADPESLNFEATESKVTTYLKGVTERFTSILLSKIPDGSDGTALAPADVTSIVKSMETCVSNPDYINDKTIENVADSSVKLMTNILTTINTKPFPVDTISSINAAIGGMIGMLESTLEALLPNSLADPNEEITTESVEAEYDDYILFNNIDLSTKTEAEKTALKERIVTILKRQKEKEREDQQRKIDLARTAVPKMLNAIEIAQRAKAAITELGQPEEVITKNDMEISVQKATFDTFLNSNASRRGVTLSFDNSTEHHAIQLWLAYFNKPVHIYGEGASRITSPTLKVAASTLDNAPISNPLTLKVGNEGVAYFKKHEPVIRPDDPDEMFYFIYDITDKNDATLFYIKPDTLDYDNPSDLAAAFAGQNFDLYITYARDDEMPSISTHDFEHQMTVRDWSGTYGFKVFIDQRFEKGKAYIALKPIKDSSSSSGSKRKKRSLVENDCHGTYINYFPRYKRSLLNTTDDTITSTETQTQITTTTIAPVTSFQPAGVNFSVIIVTTGCRSWDDQTNAWVPNGCQVLALSTLNETICRCPNPPYGSIFATTFYVPPNTIDFSTVFSKFDASNAAVYGTVLALIVIYFLALIWARRQDKKDIERWATFFLVDSDESDEYFYVVTVHTGLRRGAGTKSNVNFVVAGEDMDSGVRILSDGIREGFETSSVKKFFMGTSQPLGDLTYLRIWHDSSGNGQHKSWYLHKIFIDDPQANKRYVFQCDNWLALEQGDGSVERLLPVCGRENLVTFEKLFSGHARFNLTESHLWLSLVLRPEKSTFSRVQRLSCVLALLFLTMIASAMFFRDSSEDVSPNQVQIGFIKFSLTTVYVSFISIIITTPPILLVSIIFKKAKPAQTKNKKLTEKMQKQVHDALKDQDTKEMMKGNLNFNEEFYKDTNHPLPHWTVYIAWIIIVLAVITSAFFLILYSMQWGKPKAEEWLFSFSFSFIESLILVDPVKVIVIAVLFALLFKNPVDQYAQDVNLEKVREAAKTYNNGASRSYLNLRLDVLSKNEPPPSSQLDKMRTQRKKEMQAHQVFFELILYILYVFVLYSISYVNRDQRSFIMKNNIVDYLVTSTKTQFGFSKVTSTDNYFRWMNETLFPEYFPLTEFNDVTPLNERDKLFFGDLANARIGPARLRQVRMKQEKCMYEGLTPERDGLCVKTYDEGKEDTTQYCLEWTPYNDSSCAYTLNPGAYFTADAWRYTPSSDIWGVPILGEFNGYGGGGYILNFEVDLARSQLIIEELKRHMWIDRGTRAVFMEFTFYNANANLFAYCIFLTEFTEMGGLITWNYIQTFRPYQSVGALGTYVMVCYFVFCIVLIITTVKVCRKISALGCSFFLHFWNFLDFICIILSYISIVMWAMRLVYATQAMSKYYDNKFVFINFQHVVIWDYAFNVIMALLVFVGTIRILRLLGYNKRMTQLAEVLSRSGPGLSGFLILLGIMFFAYVSLGFLLFGSYIYDYRTLFISFGSLANTLIGKNSLDSMISAAPAFAQFYFFTYVFVVILTLMTMFAAILNQSISEVRVEVNNTKDTYGILDILTSTVRDVLGIAFTFDNKKNSKKGGQVKNKYTPKPGQNPDIDAPNILRLVRETFGELGDSKQNPDEKDPLRDKLYKYESDVERGDYDRRSQSRVYTPRDVDVLMDDFEQKTGKMYNAYL